ncbi:MAG: DegV family protein [Ruminiclostridium sp.]|nr:DegV family protein [Ruminiclostridium sp.]
MAVQFIIDSASDILPEEARELGLIHLPLTVLFGEEAYRDAVDLTHEGFYEKLVENDVLPTTSQIPPGDFAAAYEKVVEAGDEAVVITLSGKLSGTHQSAVIAAEGYEDRIFVVDSENVTIGERILVQLGLVLRNQGLSAREIAARLDEEKKNIRLLALLDTLEYLKKGGRISAATAFAGGLLSIKPVIAVEDGLVAMKGKARGSKQGNNLLRQLVEECGGIDFQKPFALAYSGLSDKLLQKYIDDSGELWQGMAEFLPISTVGCTIGTHAGPGAVAVAFFAK